MSSLLPYRKSNQMKLKEIHELHKNIVKVLRLSISKKGTSSKNYRRSNGEVGGFMPYLKVYGRSGKKCLRCGSLVQKIKHAGRGTHFCKKCQK
jgi:formamidopyrimidine-DNA glycosylase